MFHCNALYRVLPLKKKPDNLDQVQARMANQIVLECHFKTLKTVLEENDLLYKPNKTFNKMNQAST